MTNDTVLRSRLGALVMDIERPRSVAEVRAIRSMSIDDMVAAITRHPDVWASVTKKYPEVRSRA